MPFGHKMVTLKGQFIRVGTEAGTVSGILTEYAPDYIGLAGPEGATYIPASRIGWICRVNAAASFTQVYESKTYRVVLRFPTGWCKLKGYEDRYGGGDGFFHASAAGTPGIGIDEAARAEAHHSLAPYGSAPVIEKGRLHGAEARRIWPSADQFPEMEKQAALLVAYPVPVRIGGTDYSYFVLLADRHHLEAIGNTLKFMV